MDGRCGYAVSDRIPRSAKWGSSPDEPRSATIAAEADSVLYELTAEAYERIKREHPALGQALLGYIVSVMSDRLNFANRAVGVLQR